jgi:hypothetical protein
MCVSSCASTTAYLLLVVALLASALSYVAPFWILFPGNVKTAVEVLSLSAMYRTQSGLTGIFNSGTWTLWASGIWGACSRDGDSPECRWFFQNEFYAEKNLPDWHKASQGLFGGGIILLFIALLLSSFHLCCRCCKESFSITSVLGSFIITGSICIGVALGLYGGYMAKDFSVSFQEDHIMFYWAFFVGIGGAALGFVSALMYFCQGCRGRSHTGYKMTRVV